jgi:transcriptional regulator with XRE-family HTH domain
MSQTAYSRLESGKSKIDVERLYQLAALYKIPINYFFDGLPPPTNGK